MIRLERLLFFKIFRLNCVQNLIKSTIVFIILAFNFFSNLLISIETLLMKSKIIPLLLINLSFISFFFLSSIFNLSSQNSSISLLSFLLLLSLPLSSSFSSFIKFIISPQSATAFRHIYINFCLLLLLISAFCISSSIQFSQL